MMRQLVPGVPHVTFANSGAEANEKALALCRLNAAQPAGRQGARVRGRLPRPHALDPARQLEPVEAHAVPDAPATRSRSPRSRCGARRWPSSRRRRPATTPRPAPATSPRCESRFGDAGGRRAAGRRGRVAGRRARGAGHRALLRVHHRADAGRGRRSLRAPRASSARCACSPATTRSRSSSTRCRPASRLGGSFAWHEEFNLVNFRGRPDYPDAVTFAKRAQVGVCMSRFEDPEHTTVHAASLIRGRMHADMVSTEHSADRIEKLVDDPAAPAGPGLPAPGRRSARQGLRVRLRPAQPGAPRRLPGPALLARRHLVRLRRAHRALPAERELPGPRDGSAVRRPSGARWPGSTPTRARSRRSGRTRSTPPRAPRATPVYRIRTIGARRGGAPPAHHARHRAPGVRAGPAHAARGHPARAARSRGDRHGGRGARRRASGASPASPSAIRSSRPR